MVSVMETADPYTCRPQEPPPVVEVGVGAQRPAGRRGGGELVLPKHLDQRVGRPTVRRPSRDLVDLCSRRVCCF